MDKKNPDDNDFGSVSSPRLVDGFGVLKEEQNGCPEVSSKSRSGLARIGIH